MHSSKNYEICMITMKDSELKLEPSMGLPRTQDCSCQFPLFYLRGYLTILSFKKVSKEWSK